MPCHRSLLPCNRRPAGHAGWGTMHICIWGSVNICIWARNIFVYGDVYLFVYMGSIFVRIWGVYLFGKIFVRIILMSRIVLVLYTHKCIYIYMLYRDYEERK